MRLRRRWAALKADNDWRAGYDIKHFLLYCWGGRRAFSYSFIIAATSKTSPYYGGKCTTASLYKVMISFCYMRQLAISTSHFLILIVFYRIFYWSLVYFHFRIWYYLRLSGWIPALALAVSQPKHRHSTAACVKVTLLIAAPPSSSPATWISISDQFFIFSRLPFGFHAQKRPLFIGASYTGSLDDHITRMSLAHAADAAGWYYWHRHYRLMKAPQALDAAIIYATSRSFAIHDYHIHAK